MRFRGKINRYIIGTQLLEDICSWCLLLSFPFIGILTSEKNKRKLVMNQQLLYHSHKPGRFGKAPEMKV